MPRYPRWYSMETVVSMGVQLLLLSMLQCHCLAVRDCVGACPLSELTDTTKIYPGGDTRCYKDQLSSGETNPYYFQVVPGDTSKLLILFQGGGGCRSFDACSVDEEAKLSPSLVNSGIFANENDLNPFGDWTRVAILYCSGDAHLGNNLSPDGSVHFTGQANTLAVWDWITNNVPSPERVVMAGSSAGSVGLHFWSRKMANYWSSLSSPPRMAFVFGAAIPSNNETSVAAQLYRYCNQSAFEWTDEEMTLCQNEELTGEQVQLSVQSAHRNSPFFFALFKDDSVSCPRTSCDQREAYQTLKDTLQLYISAAGDNNNVGSYLLNGRGHAVLIVDPLVYEYTNDSCGQNYDLLDMLWSIAGYDETTTIPSSCSQGCEPNGRTDYGCVESIAAATFQPFLL